MLYDNIIVNEIYGRYDMSNLYNSLHNFYPVQKTLKFELIPQGKTKENMEREGILKTDQHRVAVYKKVKKYCDEYHKVFIDRCLKDLQLKELERYYELYSLTNKDDEKKRN